MKASTYPLSCAALALILSLTACTRDSCEPPSDKNPVVSSGPLTALPGTPYPAAPLHLELLDESGALALFAGETDEDTAFNAAEREADPEMHLFCNSLFLRRHCEDGTNEWRLLLTTDGNWLTADTGSDWCTYWATELKKCFCVSKARFASDDRHLWLICDPHTYTYFLVCSYDLLSSTLRVLADGDSVEECPAGTLFVKNRKTYLQDESGNPLGAAWYDEYIAPDGTVVRQASPPTQNPDFSKETKRSRDRPCYDKNRTQVVSIRNCFEE